MFIFINFINDKMVDNSAAKSHLDSVESTLNDITKPDPINSSISSRSLDLFRNLSSENLYIDADVLRNLQDIRDTLNDLGTQATNRETYLNTQIAGLPAGPGGATARANLTSEQNKVHQISVSPNRGRRLTEYQSLVNFAERFNLSTSLDDLDINTSSVPASTRHTINLVNRFMNVGWTPDRYALCDESGNEMIPSGGKYKLNIGGQEYTLENIRFTGGNLDCSSLKVTPELKNSPQKIKLSINAIFRDSTVGVRNINVVCNKTFTLNLNDGIIPLNDTARGVEFDNYNNTLPIGHKIENIIETSFVGNRYKFERTALAKILQKNGGTQYATLNNAQKEDFYQRIRNTDYGTPPLSYFDNVMRGENIDTSLNRFSGFRDWFIDDGRDRNKGENIKSDHNYVTFIHNNVSSKVGDFISSKLDHYLGNITQETFLKSELSRFIGEIENNKLDNDDTIYDDVNNYTSSDAHQIDKKNHWYEVGRDSDANYMRFFSGSSTSLKGEVVNIHTNTGPDDIGNLEPIKYDMDINISGKNSIEVEIKIEGESNPIRIKSGDPAALVRKIMRDGRIKYGKARAHMGFNVYKSMVKLAKEKNISLQYRNHRDNHTRFIEMNGGNVVIRDVDTLVGLTPSRGTVIFDQEKFINFNRFDNHGSDSSLRTGIDELGSHFTLAMNQLHNQYRHGIERKYGTLFNSNSKMSFPTSFRSSPIKKLLNIRDTTNFDFNTTVTSEGKNITIDFKKNKFTVNMEGLEKPIISKDLGKILNKRKKRVRIFDGMERDIVEGVYVALIAKLRENSKIANTDFGVTDYITGNMYVLDRDGRFGVIARENLASEGNPLRSGDYGRLNHDILDRNTVDWFNHGSNEEKELMKNPFLMQRLVKVMNKRLARW